MLLKKTIKETGYSGRVAVRTPAATESSVRHPLVMSVKTCAWIIPMKVGAGLTLGIFERHAFSVIQYGLFQQAAKQLLRLFHRSGYV
jgi:hypothetical protein